MATRRELREIIEKQKYRCAGTGIELTPASSSLDHRFPKSLGGSDDVQNLHIVHPLINRAKGDMPWDDFVAMCNAVARIHVDTGAEWWKHKRAGDAQDD